MSHSSTELNDYIKDVKDVKNLYSTNTKLEQETLKHKLITPLLQDYLSWDIISDIEINPKFGLTEEFIDYKINGKNHSFCISVEESIESAEQMEDVLLKKEVEWGITTDGRDFLVTVKRGESVSTLVKFNIKQEKSLSLIELFKKEKFNRIDIRKCLRIDYKVKTVEKIKENSNLPTTFSDIVKKNLKEQETDASFSEDFLDFLEEESEKVAEELMESLTNYSGQYRKRADFTILDGLNHNNFEEYVLSLVENPKEINFKFKYDEKSNKKYYIQFFETLFNKGFLNKENHPIQRENANTRYILNYKPFHKNQNKMNDPEKIAEQFWIECHFSIEKRLENIKYILKLIQKENLPDKEDSFPDKNSIGYVNIDRISKSNNAIADPKNGPHLNLGPIDAEVGEYIKVYRSTSKFAVCLEDNRVSLGYITNHPISFKKQVDTRLIKKQNGTLPEFLEEIEKRRTPEEETKNKENVKKNPTKKTSGKPVKKPHLKKTSKDKTGSTKKDNNNNNNNPFKEKDEYQTSKNDLISN